MAKVFLDANCLIDLYEGKNIALAKKLEDHTVYISALTIHILAYIHKIKIPNQDLLDFLSHFSVIDLDAHILANSLDTPTDDLEDNLQLHSALSESCQVFVTRDKKLLNEVTLTELSLLLPENL